MTRSLVLFVTVVLGACTVVPTVASPSPSSALATPVPALAVRAADELRVFALGPIPADSRFVYAGESGKERLLLVDPVRGRVEVAARFEGLGSFTAGRSGDISASADRRTVVLTISDSARTRVYVIRPEDAGVLSFTMAASQAPRISPDGARLVVARASDDPDAAGLWLLDTGGGHAQRLVADRTPPLPVQWSADGRYVALASSDGSMALYDTAARALRRLGSGSSPRWRGDEVDYASGGTVVAYDPRADRTRTIYRAADGARIGRFEVRRADGAIASIESAGGRQELWLHDGRDDRVLRNADNVIAMWWSDDGTHLYVWDSVEATTSISDALSGRRIVDFCLRGDVSPPCS